MVGGALADHVHGGSRETAAAGVDGASGVFDLFDETAVTVGTDHRVVAEDTDEAAATVTPVR